MTIESIGCVLYGHNSETQYNKQTYENKYILSRASKHHHVHILNNVYLSPEVLLVAAQQGGYVDKFVWCDGSSFYIVECRAETSPISIHGTCMRPMLLSCLSLIEYSPNKNYKVIDKLDEKNSLMCAYEILRTI